MGTIRKYRELRVWNAGIDFVADIYKVTEGFPKSEQFGLTSQLRRAAISVPSNLAEGHQRNTTLDYLRFVKYALGSTGELDTQLEVARRIGYLTPERYQNLDETLDEIRRMLVGLAGSLHEKLPPSDRVKEEEVRYGDS
ncbi:MAG: four helix bundle protein [Planctomycetota bacterium]|nr:four helix bundle protein [Planctomycetota bacterium]